MRPQLLEHVHDRRRLHEPNQVAVLLRRNRRARRAPADFAFLRRERLFLDALPEVPLAVDDRANGVGL